MAGFQIMLWKCLQDSVAAGRQSRMGTQCGSCTTGTYGHLQVDVSRQAGRLTEEILQHFSGNTVTFRVTNTFYSDTDDAAVVSS